MYNVCQHQQKKREPFFFLASQRAITSFVITSIGQVFWLLSFQYLFSNGSQVIQNYHVELTHYYDQWSPQ